MTALKNLSRTLVILAALAIGAKGQCPPFQEYTVPYAPGYGDALSVGGGWAAMSDTTGNQGKGSVAVYDGVFGSFYVLPKPPDRYLTASDGAAGDQFGKSIAIDAARSQIVVGAPNDDFVLQNSGSIYVFAANATTGSHIQKITVPHVWVDGHFGHSVAVDDDLMVVGAPGDDNGVGAFFVYRHNGSAWLFEQRITPLSANAGQEFGYSVAVDGVAERVLVGAPDSNLGPGAATSYVRHNGSWQLEGFMPTLFLTPLGQPARIGASVSIRGDLIAIGAPGDDSQVLDGGSVFICRWTHGPFGSGWSIEARLVPPQVDAHDNFGFSVSLRNGICVVGAPQDDDVAFNAGAAYVFRPEPAWGMTSKITDPNGSVFHHLGIAVSAFGLWASSHGANSLYQWRTAHKDHSGQGCPGSMGVPTVDLPFLPRVGFQTTLDITSSLPTVALASILIGLPTTANLGGGCTLLVDAEITVPIAVAGQLSIPIQIPADCGLARNYYAVQVVVNDPGAPLGIAVSDRLDVWFGY